MPVFAILSHPLPCPTRKTSPPNALENYKRENSVFPEASEDKNRPAVPFKCPATGQAVCGQLCKAPGERVLIPAWFTTQLSVRACRFRLLSSTCSCRPFSKYYFLLCGTYRTDPGVSVPFRIDSSCQVDQSLDLGQYQCVVMILNTQLSCVGFGCRLCWWLEAVEKPFRTWLIYNLFEGLCYTKSKWKWTGHDYKAG